jgi:hypothetical protein
VPPTRLDRPALVLALSLVACRAVPPCDVGPDRLAARFPVAAGGVALVVDGPAAELHRLVAEAGLAGVRVDACAGAHLAWFPGLDEAGAAALERALAARGAVVRARHVFPPAARP